MTQGTQFLGQMSILIVLVIIGIFAGYWALYLVLTIFSKFICDLPPSTPGSEKKIMDEINKGLKKYKK